MVPEELDGQVVTAVHPGSVAGQSQPPKDSAGQPETVVCTDTAEEDTEVAVEEKVEVFGKEAASIENINIPVNKTSIVGICWYPDSLPNWCTGIMQ